MEYLAHYGVKGMKWGVRRYRNEDGSLTDAGERRYSSGKKRKLNKKKALAIGAAVAGTAALAFVASNPKARKFVTNVASSSVKSLKSAITSPKTKAFVSSMAKKTSKRIGEGLERAGNAAVDAAIASIGAMLVKKLSDKLAANDNDDTKTKDKKEIVLNMSKAAVNAAITNNKTSNNGNNKNISKKVSNIIGPPSNKPIDRSSVEYQTLFKDKNGNQLSPETRSTIKSLAASGYDINQIKKYLRSV